METQVPLSEEQLRVLVVDDDPVCSKIITRMLRHCNYQVTEAGKARDGLETLKKNPQSFDMVITETRNDMEVVWAMVKMMKMENIPVVLVSGSDDNSSLMEGVVQGAEEILSKPVSLAKIKTLWQHVYRTRLKKEEDEAGKRKKRRVRWEGRLQDKFVEAVEKLGGPNQAMPKKIMELMGVPAVSRECVASHLQKYRKQKDQPPNLQALQHHSNNQNHQYQHQQQQPTMFPTHPCYDHGRYELVPLPALVTPPPSDVNLIFSGDPWHDTGLLESALLSHWLPH